MGVFPFINPEAIQEDQKAELPLFREYAYDFEKNCLKLRDGKSYLVEGNEALRTWIFFALATERYRYVAHSRGYGSEIEKNIIGQNMDDDITQSELERFITEALMVNPYIKELSEFTFESQGEHMTVSFQCLTVYGKDKVSYVVKGVI